MDSMDYREYIKETQIDIIDEEYRLLYEWPQEVDKELLIQFFRPWMIPYIEKYDGFLISASQLLAFKDKLFQKFGIFYMPPQLKSYQQIFAHCSQFKNKKLNLNDLSLTQCINLEKASYYPLKMILNQPWGFGKTLLSLKIAKAISDGDLLVIISPEVFHYHWKIHIQRQYPSVTLYSQCQELLQQEIKQTSNVCLLDQEQVPHKILLISPKQSHKISYLRDQLKTFIIYDQVHLIQDAQILHLKVFTNILGLTNFDFSCDPQIQIKLLALLCESQPLSSIKQRYSKEEDKKYKNQGKIEYFHLYELACAIRNFLFMSFQESKQLKPYFDHRTTYLQFYGSNQPKDYKKNYIPVDQIIKNKCKYIEEFLTIIINSNPKTVYKLYYQSKQVFEMAVATISMCQKRKNGIILEKMTEIGQNQSKEMLNDNNQVIHVFLQFPSPQLNQDFMRSLVTGKIWFLTLKNSLEQQIQSVIISQISTITKLREKQNQEECQKIILQKIIPTQRKSILKQKNNKNNSKILRNISKKVVRFSISQQ